MWSAAQIEARPVASAQRATALMCSGVAGSVVAYPSTDLHGSPLVARGLSGKLGRLPLGKPGQHVGVEILPDGLVDLVVELGQPGPLGPRRAL